MTCWCRIGSERFPVSRAPEPSAFLPRRRFAGMLDAPEVTTMERKKASDFDQGLLNLFDEYVHGLIDRRAFLERAARFAVGGVSAGMLLDALNPKFAEAQQVATVHLMALNPRAVFIAPHCGRRRSNRGNVYCLRGCER